MKNTTKLKSLIHASELLVMPGAFDPISAKLIEQAGFQAIQCSGLGISAVHLGLPDYSFLAMSDMVNCTRKIVEVVSIPVMGDGDTGFGNAVNAHYTAKAFERAGAAGVNLEDQVMPKRCGHLEGKQIVPIEEAVAKIRAAADGRSDPDFVINARTDALAVAGMAEVVRRGNAYLEAGATMVFIDGITSRDEIQHAVKHIRGPVAINLVEGGKSPAIGFKELEAIGVARVSLPGTLLFAAVRAMQMALQNIQATGSVSGNDGNLASFRDVQKLIGMEEISKLENEYLHALMA